MADSLRVLIVDDHPATREGLSLLLEREPNFSVFGAAGTRQETLELLRRDTPDAAILDIALEAGKPSGLDLIADVHSMAGIIPIVVVSMYDRRFFAERALEAGARGYVSKQAPVAEIIKALRRAVSGKTYCAVRTTDGVERPGLEKLSPREFEVFRLLGQGMPVRRISESLGFSVKTAESHKFNIRKKLGLSTMDEVWEQAVQWFHENC